MACASWRKQMIYIRKECESVKNGFNFYALSDKGSFGFIFRLRNFQFMCRYSKMIKKWILK